MTAQVKARARLAICVILAASTLCRVATADMEGQQPRVWTDVQGRKITAALVAVEGDSVKLKMGGKLYTVPLVQVTQFRVKDHVQIRT